MRLVAGVLVASTILATASVAGRPDYEKAAREAMAKVSFLVGHWEGEASMDMGPGARHDLVQKETVESRLDGLVLVVEGIGHTKDEGRLIHHAVAFVSYDARAERYRVVAYRQDGETVDATATILPDGALQWSFDTTGKRGIRYTIRLSESGEWLETGEITHDGERWLPFMEMRLRRVS